MNENNSSQGLQQQKISQGAIKDKKYIFESFREYLEYNFTAPTIKELYQRMGVSVRQMGLWINDPRTIPFVDFYLLQELGVIPTYDYLDKESYKTFWKFMKHYKIGADAMTLRDYHHLRRFNFPMGKYRLMDFLRYVLGSVEKLDQYIRKQLPIIMKEKSTRKIILWLNNPQRIPFEQARLLVTALEELPVTYDAWMVFKIEKDKVQKQSTILSIWSLHCIFEIGYDTIFLRDSLYK